MNLMTRSGLTKFQKLLEVYEWTFDTADSAFKNGNMVKVTTLLHGLPAERTLRNRYNSLLSYYEYSRSDVSRALADTMKKFNDLIIILIRRDLIPTFAAIKYGQLLVEHMKKLEKELH